MGIRRAATCAAAALVSVTALIGCGSSSSQRSASTSRPRSASVVPAVAPVDVAYRSVGTGPRTLILVHGGPGAPTPGMLKTFAPLAGHGFRVVYYDQRGVGASPKPPVGPGAYGPDAYIADLERLRQRLGVSSMDLFGTSWGGAVVSLYTAAHPNRVHALVESDGQPLDPVAYADTQAHFARRLATLQAAGVIPRELPGPLRCVAGARAIAPVFAPDAHQYPAYRQALAPPSDSSCAADATATTETNTDMAIAGQRVSQLMTALHRWTGPALVLEGAEDPFGPAMERADAAQFQSAHLTRLIVTHAGHIPFLDDPGLLTTVQRFLTR